MVSHPMLSMDFYMRNSRRSIGPKSARRRGIYYSSVLLWIQLRRAMRTSPLQLVGCRLFRGMSVTLRRMVLNGNVERALALQACILIDRRHRPIHFGHLSTCLFPSLNHHPPSGKVPHVVTPLVVLRMILLPVQIRIFRL